MDSLQRKKATVLTKYVAESFRRVIGTTLGQLTGKLNVITDHPRLFRSLTFGDPDYEYCVAQVLDTIFSDEPRLISEVIDHFDVDLWYQQKEPDKYRRVFQIPPSLQRTSGLMGN